MFEPAGAADIHQNAAILRTGLHVLPAALPGILSSLPLVRSAHARDRAGASVIAMSSSQQLPTSCAEQDITKAVAGLTGQWAKELFCSVAS